MTVAVRLVRLLVTFAVPVILFAGNVRLLATETFLRFEYGRAGFPDAPGFTADERLAAAVPSTRFIVSDDDRATLESLRHDGEALYGSDEIDHLLDVRTAIRRLDGVALGAGIAVVLVALAAWPDVRRRRSWRRALGWGGGLAVALVLAVGAGIAVAWPFVFTTFHELFFPPGTWQFPADSGLIRLFPERFWFDTAVLLAGSTLGEGAAILALTRPWSDR